MNWRRLVIVLAVAATLPLLAPATWLRAGPYPDLGLLVVLFVALEAGPDHATRTGVVLGLLLCPFTTEPLGLQAFLLGASGFAAGLLARSLYRERLGVRIALAGAGAALLRIVSTLILADADAAVAVVPAALLCGAATAAAAPPVFALLAALRMTPRRARRRSGAIHV